MSPGVRTRFQTFGRTQRGSGPKFYLALGAGVCARTEEPLPTASDGNGTVGVLERGLSRAPHPPTVVQPYVAQDSEHPSPDFHVAHLALERFDIASPGTNPHTLTDA